MNLEPSCRAQRLAIARAAVGDDAGKRRADLRLDLGQDGRQRTAVVRVARHRLHVRNDLAARRAMQGRGERDLDAKFVGPMRVALADAFDLRRVQGIYLLPPLMLALLPYGEGERQGLREDLAQTGRRRPSCGRDRGRPDRNGCGWS